MYYYSFFGTDQPPSTPAVVWGHQRWTLIDIPPKRKTPLWWKCALQHEMAVGEVRQLRIAHLRLEHARCILKANCIDFFKLGGVLGHKPIQNTYTYSVEMKPCCFAGFPFADQCARCRRSWSKLRHLVPLCVDLRSSEVARHLGR